MPRPEGRRLGTAPALIPAAWVSLAPMGNLRGLVFLLWIAAGCGGAAVRHGTDAASDATNDAVVPDAAERDAANGTDASVHDGAALDASPVVDSGADGAAAWSLAERVCLPMPFPASPLPSELSERVATRLQGGFGFLEGPLWIAEQGILLFTDMDFSAPASASGPPARIRRFTPPNTFDVWVEQGNSNGLALGVDQDVIACSHDVQSLSTFDRQTRARSPLPLLYQGDHFNSPNDVTVRSDGSIYFTDPDWQIGTRDSETGMTGVYRKPPMGDVELVIGTVYRPNGIALSPDERTLYVGSAENDVLRFAVGDDGSVGASEVFVSPGASDGFAVDCAGNLYVTTGAVVKVFAPDRTDLGTITLPPGGNNPSNAAFGGPASTTLFITAGSALYSIELLVMGLPY